MILGSPLALSDSGFATKQPRVLFSLINVMKNRNQSLAKALQFRKSDGILNTCIGLSTLLEKRREGGENKVNVDLKPPRALRIAAHCSVTNFYCVNCFVLSRKKLSFLA